MPAQSLQPRIWLILISISALVFLISIDYMAANLALLPISKDTGADLNNLQWLMSGYVLIWGAFVVPAGRLADLYGKKLILLTGIVVFLLGSIVTGIGSSIEVLIIGRLLQGIGAAVFSPACYSLIFSTMPPDKQGTAMGVLMGINGIGLALGPTLAGILLEYLNWRWIFFINVPIGVAVIISALKLIPNDCPSDQAEKIDVPGAFLLAMGIGLFMIGLNQIEMWGIFDLRLMAFVGCGIVVLILFYFRNQAKIPQTLPMELFRNKALMSTIYSVSLSSFNFSMILVMLGIYIQNTLSYTSYESGLIFLAMTLAIGLLSPVGGWLADRMDMRIPIVFGLGVLSFTLFLMGLLDQKTHLSYLMVCLFLSGLGLGLSFPCLNTAMFRCVESKEINISSSVFTMAMMLGNTIGVIVSTSLISMIGRSYLFSKASLNHLSLADQNQLADMLGVMNHEGLQIFSAEALSLLNDSFCYGLSWNMRIGSALALIGALIVAVKLKNISKTHIEEKKLHLL